MLPVCSKCGKSGLYQNWPIIGGTRSGSMIAGGVLLCPACATEEIAQLRADLELDVEFMHTPGCTGKGISRMCAGCIEAEQLRHFAEIDRLTAIVDRLPKTEDGVPVLLRDTMYAVCDGDLVEEVTAWLSPRSGKYLGCYSTRAAAEAAKGFQP